MWNWGKGAEASEGWEYVGLWQRHSEGNALGQLGQLTRVDCLLYEGPDGYVWLSVYMGGL